MDGRVELASALAGLVTFTVGFLTVRLHAMHDQFVESLRAISLDLLQRTQDPLDAADMLALTSNVSLTDDKVSSASLWMNRGMLFVGLAVLASALVDEAAPLSHKAYVAILVGAQLVVTAIGEYDVRYVRTSLTKATESSLAGRLMLFANRLEDPVVASDKTLLGEFAAIAGDIPNDAARTQLQALVEYRCDQPERAWELATQAVQDGNSGSLGWQAGVAAAVRLNDLKGASQLLRTATHYAGRSRHHLEEVHQALLLRRGDASALFADDRGLSALVIETAETDVSRETRRLYSSSRAIVPTEIVELVNDLVRYHTPTAAEFLRSHSGSEQLADVLTAAKALEAGDALPPFREGGSSGYLEAMTWLYLAADDRKLTLECGEQAARRDPGNPRVHWLLAMFYLGEQWHAQAAASLTRCSVLNPSDSVLNVTLAILQNRRNRASMRITDTSAWSGRDQHVAAAAIGLHSVGPLAAPNPAVQSTPEWLASLLAERIASLSLIPGVGA